MASQCLPIDIIFCVYNLCDVTTRININRAFNWKYSFINPYKGHKFIEYKKSYAYKILCAHKINIKNDPILIPLAFWCENGCPDIHMIATEYKTIIINANK